MAPQSLQDGQEPFQTMIRNPHPNRELDRDPYWSLDEVPLTVKKVDAIKRTGLHPRDEIVSAGTDLSADLLVISTHGYKPGEDGYDSQLSKK
jgi:hypothetical protein